MSAQDWLNPDQFEGFNPQDYTGYMKSEYGYGAVHEGRPLLNSHRAANRQGQQAATESSYSDEGIRETRVRPYVPQKTYGFAPNPFRLNMDN